LLVDNRRWRYHHLIPNNLVRNRYAHAR
jgi:hypothetical protein